MEAKGLTRLFLDNGDNAELSLNGSGSEVNHRDPTGNLAILLVMLEKMYLLWKL